MKVIETERLVLSKLSVDDAGFIFELVNEPPFIQNIGNKGVKKMADACLYILDGPVASYHQFGFGLYLVQLKASGLPIGMCGLLKRDTLDDPDIGYAFLQRFWSKGYAYESASAVMDYARDIVGLKRVLAVISPTNQSSIRLAEKLGFLFEKMVKLPGYEEDSMLFERNFQ